MMTPLDSAYASLLQVGFIGLRKAIDSGKREWIDAEIEMLHNIPSLIGEENVARHRYYWFKERVHYVDWACAPGRTEAISHMRTYYEPIWNEMEPHVEHLLGQTVR